MYRIRAWLTTGTLQEAQNADGLRTAGINAVLSLHRPVTHDGIATQFTPMQEGFPITDNTLHAALTFIDAHRADDGHIMIACGSGISRSATIAIAALCHVESLSLMESFTEIRKNHPKAMPDEVHWRTLTRYFDDPLDFWEMWRTIEL